MAKLDGGWPAHAAIRRGSSSHSRSPALLAVFLVYTALSGTTPALQPSNLAGHTGTRLADRQGDRRPVPGDAHTPAGLQFKLHNINGASPTIPIVYHGSVPDLFKIGRDVNVTGAHAAAARSSRPR